MVRPDHDRQRGTRSVRGRVQHMRQQRLAGDGVQHLRQRGPHARALAGRKHDSQAGSSGHSGIPLAYSLADNADGAGPSLIVFPGDETDLPPGKRLGFECGGAFPVNVWPVISAGLEEGQGAWPRNQTISQTSRRMTPAAC